MIMTREQPNTAFSLKFDVFEDPGKDSHAKMDDADVSADGEAQQADLDGAQQNPVPSKVRLPTEDE